MPAPTTLSMPRGMWGEPYHMGVNGADNIVEENVGAYNTAWVLSCQRGRRVLFLQVYKVRSPVSWFDLCALPCFLRSFPISFRASIPGRLVPVGSDCASRRRTVSRVFTYPGRRHGVGVGSSALARPSGRRGYLEAAGVRASAPIGEVGRSWKMGAIPPWPGLSVGDWVAPFAYRSGTWAGP